MRSKRLKHYTLIAILLINQLFALSVMACAQPTMQELMVAKPAIPQMQDEHPCHESMTANPIQLTQQVDSSAQTMDCCDAACHCPMSMCNNVVLTHLNSALVIRPSHALIAYYFSSQTSAVTPHQKPPQIS